MRPMGAHAAPSHPSASCLIPPERILVLGWRCSAPFNCHGNPESERTLNMGLEPEAGRADVSNPWRDAMNFGPRSQVSRVGLSADPLAAMQRGISGMLAEAAPFFAPGVRLVQLYLRVIGLLAPEARLAWVLVGANVGIAVSQFAEPV